MRCATPSVQFARVRAAVHIVGSLGGGTMPKPVLNRWLASVLVGAGAWLVVGSPRAATLTVDPSVGSGGFATIQGAVDAASNGDTISIVPGTYLESVLVSGKIVKLVGQGEPGDVRLTGAEVLLRIEGVANAGTIVENIAFQGGTVQGVVVTDSAVVFRHVSFEGNGDGTADGAGLSVSQSKATLKVRLEDCRFASNNGSRGGGLFATGGLLDLDGVSFEGNNAALDGGGAWVSQAEVTAARVFGCGNHAGGQGGAWRQEGGALEVLSGIFQGNSAGNGGVTFWLQSVAKGSVASLHNIDWFDAGASQLALVDVAVDVRNAVIAHPAPGPWAELGPDVVFDLHWGVVVGSSDGLWGPPDAKAVANVSDLQTVASLDDLELYDGASLCGPGAWEPKPGSPAIDAGDPALTDAADGSPSDAGAYGGPQPVEAVHDADDDGVVDYLDNCPQVPNPSQADEDGDGLGDVCDEPVGPKDSDDDGIVDAKDNCPKLRNPGQEDADHDGIGDVCDPNDDNDPSPDVEDCAPLDPTVYVGAQEICNGIDDDCDGNIDQGIDCLGTPDAGGTPLADASGPSTGGDAGQFFDASGAGAGADATDGEVASPGEGGGGGGGGGCRSGRGARWPGLGGVVAVALALGFSRRRRARWTPSS